MVPVTSIFAAVLAFLYVYLATRVIGARRKARIAVGTGDDKALLRASRVHGNFAEYVPLALILMGVGELNGAPWWVVGLLGLALLAGRVFHAYGVSKIDEDLAWRVRGMGLTFGSIVSAAMVAFGFGIWSALS